MNTQIYTQSQIQTWLINYLSESLEIDPKSIDVTLPFESYGLDSSATVVMSGDLQTVLGIDLEPTIMFDYPTIEALSQHLGEED